MTNHNENQSQERNTESESEGQTSSLRVPELNFSKLAFLFALAFFFSSLGPFALFATIPLSFSFLLYGRAKTFLLSFAATGLTLVMVKMGFYEEGALGTFPMATLYGFLIFESIRRGIHPVEGIIRNGFSLFVIVMVCLLTFQFFKEGGLRGVITPYVQKISTVYYNSLKDLPDVPPEQLRQLQDLQKSPSLVVDIVMDYGVSALFIGIFLSLWVGTFVTIKLKALWREFYPYPYDIKILTSFKLPFFFVWPLIAGLVLAVCHAYGYFGDWAKIVGYNLLLMLGIFYFFQGFGILSFALNRWRIFGFLRTMLIVFTVMTGYQVLALVGVLDTWIDFRRFFNDKNNNEGDRL